MDERVGKLIGLISQMGPELTMTLSAALALTEGEDLVEYVSSLFKLKDAKDTRCVRNTALLAALTEMLQHQKDCDGFSIDIPALERRADALARQYHYERIRSRE